MSDQQGEGLFNPQGSSDGGGTPSESPETPSQPVEESGQESQPQFVTADVLDKKLTEFERKIQSSRDSALSTFDKRIKAKIEQVEKDNEELRKLGVKLTPDQEQQRRLNAMQQAMLENPDAQSSSPQPAQATQGQDVEAIRSEVNARAKQYMDQVGITFEEGDPELMLLDHSSPDAYLSSLRMALYQKRVRSGDVQPPSAQARVPSMAQGSTALKKKEQLFLDEYKAAEGKGLSYARAIRQKWAAEGVDVNALTQQLS
jgi:hypothetical protein